MSPYGKKKGVRDINSLRKNLIILLTLNLSLLLFAAGYVIYFYLSDGESLFFECYVKERFGFYCPGCGGSRSLAAFIRLDFISSFILYPPIIISAIVIIDYDIRLIITLVKRNTEITDKFKFYTFILIPVSIILSFLIKNILLFVFRIDTIGDFIP